MSFYKKNLSAIRAKEPRLADRLESVAANRSARLIQTGSASPTIEFTPSTGGGTILFQKEAAAENVSRLSQKKLFSFSEVVILLGAGLGETLTDTLKSVDSTAFVLLIESSTAYFKKLIEGFDLEKSLSDPRVSISVGEKPLEAVMGRLEREFGIFTRPNFQVIKNPLSLSCDKEYYRQVEQALAKQKAIARSNLKSISTLSGKWHGNLFANLPYLLKSCGIKPLFGTLKGLPAIIVAAGPSLDKNCRWLKQAENSFVIICVDTALKTLIKYGVRPHFVVCLDAKMENYTHMAGVDTSAYTLVANPVTYPLILAEHHGDLLTTGYTEPLVKWLERFTGDMGENVTGGSVATAAFDFAYRLGCSPIVLTGQDLAYSGGRTHSGGGAVQEMVYSPYGLPVMAEWMHSRAIEVEELEEVEGNMGHTLNTSTEMNNWKSWFEIRIENKSINCINATEGGLAIKGARKLTLQEAVMNFAGDRQKNIDGIINRSISTRVPVDPERVKEGLEALMASARRIKNSCSLGIREAEKLKDSAQRKGEEKAVAQANSACVVQIRSIMKESEFMTVNHWRLESMLDKIQRLQSGLKPAEGSKRSYLDAEIYLIFFREVYKVSREFESNCRSFCDNSEPAEAVKAANVY